MGRRAKYSYQLPDGRRVGYSPKDRAGLFRVQFRHPTEPGKYIEAATGVAVPKGWGLHKSPPPAWSAEAEKAIRSAYTAPGGGDDKKGRATWEEAERYLMEDIGRAGSERTYRSALALLRAGLPALSGPADVTPAHATRFAKTYTAEPYRRSKSADGVLRPRSPRTVWTTLNNLSVLWGRLKKLGLVAENVWAEVDRPRLPKKQPRVPTEEAVQNLLSWLDRRFPGPEGAGWELLRTFVRVKMYAGCRLNDLCQAESGQFDPTAGTLLLTADQDKTHQERLITLTPELAAALVRLKGDRFLWERYAADSAVFRPGRGRAESFTPRVLYHAVQSIFREYNAKNPAHRVRTHDLRKRAITIVGEELNGNLEAVAQVIPVTPETARRHYFDAQRASNAAAIQRRVAARLLGECDGGGTNPAGETGDNQAD